MLESFININRNLTITFYIMSCDFFQEHEVLKETAQWEKEDLEKMVPFYRFVLHI